MNLKSFLFVNFLFSIISLTALYNCVNIKPAKNKTKLGLSETAEVNEGECREMVIPNNYKRLVLGLESTNINRVLLTDVRLDKCDEAFDLSKCCSRNSTFCIENVHPSQNDFRLNYCIDYTYLYACNLKSVDNLNLAKNETLINSNTSNISNNSTTNNSTIVINNSTTINSTIINGNSTVNNSSVINANSTINSNSTNGKLRILANNSTNSTMKGSITVTTSIIKGRGCHTTEFIPETACSSIGLNSCKDPVKCSSKCEYIECRKDSTQADTRIFGMCLPTNLTNSDIINRCKNHIAFQDSSPQVYKQTCNKKEEEMTYQPAQSSHSFFKFILIVFGVLVLVTFISSVYYRFKMGIDGVPPFDPPSFAPNFIFPRQTSYY